MHDMMASAYIFLTEESRSSRLSIRRVSASIHYSAHLGDQRSKVLAELPSAVQNESQIMNHGTHRR